MKIVAAIDRVLTSLAGAILIGAFSVMLVLAITQLLLRGIFHAGILWGDLAARHLVIWVGFLGAFLATREGRHFRIDAIARFLGPRAKPWVKGVTDLFAGLVCAALVGASWSFVTVGLDPGAVLLLGIRQTTAAAIVPAGFGLIALQFLLKSLQGFVGAVRAGSGAASS